MWVDESTWTFTFAPLGVERAQAAVDALAPQGGFCAYAIPAVMQARLDEISELAAAGQRDEAVALIGQIRAEVFAATAGAGGGRAPGLAAPLRQDPEGVREAIRVALELAELEILLGLGDGSETFGRISKAYRDLFEREVGDASMEDLMRLGDEALRLGEEDLAAEAWDLATEMAARALDDAVAGFDPCTAFPVDIYLLERLMDQAVLMGVDGVLTPGDARYDAYHYNSAHAFSRLNPGAALPDSIEMPDDPPPECILAELEVQLRLEDCGGGVAETVIPLAIQPQGPLTLEDEVWFGKERFPYSVRGEGDISWSGPCGCGTFTLNTSCWVKGSYLAGDPVGTLELAFSHGGGTADMDCAPIDPVGAAPTGGSWDLRFPMEDGATQRGPGGSGWVYILHVQER
jgi:hypothetical protein